MTFDLSKKKSLRFPRHFGSNCLVWDENQQGQLNFSPFFDFPHSIIKALLGNVEAIAALYMLEESLNGSHYGKKKPLPTVVGAVL